eukprot:9946538-Heterocapsa_arctica.AAC.1
MSPASLPRVAAKIKSNKHIVLRLEIAMAIHAPLSASRSLTVASTSEATWKVSTARAIALSVGADTVPLMPSMCAPPPSFGCMSDGKFLIHSRPYEPYRRRLSCCRNVWQKCLTQGGGQPGWDTRAPRSSRTSRSAVLRGRLE